MKKYSYLLVIHTWYQLLDLIRQPMYIITTLIFPGMFFWFFGVPNAKNADAAAMLVGSFSSFAILGVVLFQFSISIAQEKTTPWSHFMQTLPLPSSLFLLPKVLNAFFIAALSVTAVILIGVFCTPLNWRELPWIQFATALLMGAIPFVLLGACLGYGVSSKSIVPVANLFYLPLSFAGGLWLPPTALPKAVQDISQVLPTRFFGEIVWSVLLETNIEKKYLFGLTCYGIAFLLVSAIVFKRNQEQEFH